MSFSFVQGEEDGFNKLCHYIMDHLKHVYKNSLNLECNTRSTPSVTMFWRWWCTLGKSYQ